MEQYLQILAFAAMPALGNFFGGLIAEFMNVSKKTLSLALHVAAGIVIAVVSIELMPRALKAEQAWIVILAFFAGGVLFALIDKAVDYIQERFGKRDKSMGPSSMWAIYIAVFIDLFSDGVMIGTGSAIVSSLGFLLALGQVPADLPEGFATIATFKNNPTTTRKKRILVAASFAIPVFMGATIGYFGVKDSPEIVQLSLLALTAGILFTASIEEMISEANRNYDAPLAGVFLVGGFALFAFIAVYFG